MRSRVRQAVSELAQSAATDPERDRWNELSAQMDSARISTIHSLCAEILRSHPAEALIDPKSGVLDEGNTSALMAEVLEDSLARLVSTPEMRDLFKLIEIKNLRNLLAFLLNERLDAEELLGKNIDMEAEVRKYIQSILTASPVADCIKDLRCMSNQNLLDDAGDKLALQLEDLLALWEDAENLLKQNDLIGCARLLFRGRREKMSLVVGKKTSQAKSTLAELRDHFDDLLNPLTGGAKPGDEPPDPDTETRFTRAMELIPQAFTLLHNDYKAALQDQHMLDFDDLENGAVRLLQKPEIRARWQEEIAALLVDEFQDTNERQRTIVEALAGTPGRLFVVGDDRQSIYRFRRADVTVFRGLQDRIRKEGGLSINLDQTYRAHQPLLEATGDLLAAVMGTEEDPSRPYYVPFSALQAVRLKAPEHFKSPHVEMVVGGGEDTASAKQLSARALAERLRELRDQGQIHSWDDVTLLFRATRAYTIYENAFEEAGIPFVTVAGRGFYDRPEIRDLLNILRALADPADDLAMAGLLRSPAFGLTDAALYQLRWQAGKATPYWRALNGDLSILDESDRVFALRARDILAQLLPVVDRVPVSELLKMVVDAVDYRSILATAGSGAGGRLWRNLDKLILDAEESGQVNVRDFLNYLATLNATGAREGEAPAEALGAVRLMTIHSSKGLEFPVVILADAGREAAHHSEPFYLLPELGLSFSLDKAPLFYRLSKMLDTKQDEAETQRLLYVALTRAKEKLIICGHATVKSKGDWSTKGWMEELATPAGVDITDLMQTGNRVVDVITRNGNPIRALGFVSLEAASEAGREDQPIEIAEPEILPIYISLIESEAPAPAVDEEAPVTARWRVTGPIAEVDPKVIGSMVHKALELWLFPGDAHLQDLLESAALTAGLALPSQREKAIRQALELLTRMRSHSMHAEIETALEVHREIPYNVPSGNYAEAGYLDVLYRIPAGWQIVDFKTDTIQSNNERERLLEGYTPQLRRYARALMTQLGEKCTTRLCFLDDRGKVSLVEVV